MASSDGLQPGTCAKCGKSPKRSFSGWRTLSDRRARQVHARDKYCLDYSAAVAAALGTEFQEPNVCFGCRQVSAKLDKGKNGRKGMKRKLPEPSEAEEDVSALCPQSWLNVRSVQSQQIFVFGGPRGHNRLKT